MDLGLKDKTIFVAGASRGIGLGIVEACLAEGAKVAITARGAEALEATRARLAAQYGQDRLWAMAGDLRVTEVIEEALAGAEAALGPVWGAVANVGLHPCPPGAEVDDETWDGGFSQNLGSAWKLARGAYRRMEPRGEGAILFISSIAGLGALGSPMTYGTAKAAMNHMAKELARITGPNGVRVNAIAPGKRPLSSMTPTILVKDGLPAMVIGTPGGSRIFTSVFQVLADVYDFDMPLDQAVAAMRVHHQLLPKDTITFEPYALAPAPLARDLIARGYRIETQDFNGDIEAVQVVGRTPVVAPDPRARGYGMIIP